MARPGRRDVDYYPHIIKKGKTLFILENKYGLEGYGFFYKILDFLAERDNHFFQIADDSDLLFLASHCLISDETRVLDMLMIMSKTGKIDPQLWTEKRVIFSPHFVETIADAYRDRKATCITLSYLYEFYGIFNPVLETPQNGVETPEKCSLPEFPVLETQAKHDLEEFPVQKPPINPQIKLNKIKEKNIRAENFSNSFSADKEPEPKPDPSNRFEELKNTANSLGTFAGCQRSFATIPGGKIHDVLSALQVYTDHEIVKAIENYAKIRAAPTDYKLFPVYADLIGFLISGVDQYRDSADPFNRCAIKGKRAEPEKARPPDVKIQRDSFTCDCGESVQVLDDSGICKSCWAEYEWRDGWNKTGVAS